MKLSSSLRTEVLAVKWSLPQRMSPATIYRSSQAQMKPIMTREHNSKKWLFGDVGCRLWLTADVWLSTASIYNLLAISFDRYMAVRQPIRYPSISSKRVTRLLVTLVWLFSGLLAMCLFVLETLDNSQKQECTPMKLPSLYIIFSASASFIVPAAIMIALNVSIFCTVLTTTRTKCVSVKNGESMRIHRGKRKSLANKFTKQYSCDSNGRDANAYDQMSPMIERSAVKAQPVTTIGHDEEPKSMSPILKNLLSHVMVVSLISTSKKKRLNVITHLGGFVTDAPILNLFFSPKNKTYVGHNVRTLNRTGSLAQLLHGFDNYRLDILGISEVCWKGNGRRNSDNETILFSGHEDKHEEGVGFVLNRKAANALNGWKPIKEKIIIARFATRHTRITIMQLYAPTKPRMKK
ncbi:7 transmembrane receptor [Teladorsagia circumcincta]|uniref:7 transmembrane receptor n=1 Tax=Teladorsagia circumcincta TaxID=45464 RepID=A0A2G9UWP8_TELCI|nr:7 transmembrane receptor [Teladorsagia circumcincta]